MSNDNQGEVVATSARPSLKALALKAMQDEQQSKDAAGMAVESKSLAPAELAALRDLARLNLGMEAILAEMEGANNAIRTDPRTRRQWLRAQIVNLEKEPRIEPDRFLALMFSGMSRTLGDGMALNLFTPKPIRDMKIWRTRFVYPNIDRDNVLKVGGLTMIVPATEEDAPALRALRATRHRVLLGICASLEGETMIDVKKYLRYGLMFIDRATITSATDINQNYTAEDRYIRHNRSGNTFNSVSITDKDVFIAPTSPVSDQFFERFRQLVDYMKEFEAGVVDVEDDIREIVAEYGDNLLTGEEFLSRKPGVLVVRHNAWRVSRDSETVSEVVVVFDRRTDGAWRWAIANAAGVKSLFSDKLSFHEFTRDQVPPHVKALIKTGVATTK